MNIFNLIEDASGWMSDHFQRSQLNTQLDGVSVALQRYSLKIDPSVNSKFNLAKLVEALVGNSTSLDGIPKDIQESFFETEILELSLVVDDKLTPIDIHLSFGWPEKDWVVVPEILALKKIKLTLQGTRNHGDIILDGTVQGTVSVSGTELNCRMDYPDGGLVCRLDESTPIKLKSIVSHLGLSTSDMVGTGLANLSVSDFSIRGNYISRAFIFDVTLSNALTFQNFNLSTLNIALIYIAGSPAPVSGSFLTKIDFGHGGHSHLELAASYAGSGQGWQFEGGLVFDDGLKLETIVHTLERSLLRVPLTTPIPDAEIDKVHVSFDTHTGNIKFNCIGELVLDATSNKTESLEIDVDLKKVGTTHNRHIAGKIIFDLPHDASSSNVGDEDTAPEVDQLRFDVSFDQSGASKTLLATYSSVSGNATDLGKFVAEITDDANLKQIAQSLHLEMKEAFLVYDKRDTPREEEDDETTSNSGILLGVKMGGGVNLAGLPLVGKLLPTAEALNFTLQPVLASTDFSKSTIEGVAKLLPNNEISFPKDAVSKGPHLSTEFKAGDREITLNLPIKLGDQANAGKPVDDASAPVKPSTPKEEAQTEDGTKWFKLQKNFGPVHFERVGAAYKNGNVTLKLDGALSAAGITLSLEGLGVQLTLEDLSKHKFEPHFELQGLGLDFKKGPLEIGGSFLHEKLDDPEIPGAKYDAYSGAIVLKTKAFSLSAIGSYARYHGKPSLFIYGVLDYPLGGPAFFFVTGLSAGFGYNRSVKMPAMDKVGEHPLVSEAVGGAAMDKDADPKDVLTAKLKKFAPYLPPKTGQYFVAVGVKFTSFKLIDSFILLSVSFGKHFEVDILGMSTVVLPPAIPGNTLDPLAEIQMALKATFIPDEGFLGVQAQLTENSFVLSRDCHLTGGFAFFSWFSGPHAGEFVETVGGYHPHFKVPAHYPRVPRLGFNWKLSDTISIKGGAYFALTSHAMMAGGRLEAHFEDGSISASFIIGADFLISWQPFHYDAAMYMEVHANVPVLGDIDIGAQIHVWGPEFSGMAELHWGAISYTVEFGGGKSSPKRLSWDKTKASFLPDDETQYCGITITNGLMKETSVREGNDTTTYYVVNVRDFSFTTSSIIPSKTARLVSHADTINGPEFGVAPMGLRSGHLEATHKVKVSKIGSTSDISSHFKIRAAEKRLPTALWGEKLLPSPNGAQYIEGGLSGLEISLADPATKNEAVPVSFNPSGFSTTRQKNIFRFTKARPRYLKTSKTDFSKNQVATAKLRNTIFADQKINSTQLFEFSDPISADEFLFVPHVVTETQTGRR